MVIMTHELHLASFFLKHPRDGLRVVIMITKRCDESDIPSAAEYENEPYAQYVLDAGTLQAYPRRVLKVEDDL